MSALQREDAGDGVAVLRLDRPHARNALDTAAVVELHDALGDLGADPATRVVVLSTTSARAFCAGADLGEELDPHAAVARMERFSELYLTLEAVPVPVVCVCVGDVVGGGAELAAGADLRVGGDNLKLAWAGARLGVPVGPARLVPLVGLSRAKELIFSGRVVRMPEAHAIGFLHRTAPAELADGAAVAFAREIAAHPPEGLRRLKAIFREFDGAAPRIAHENALLEEFQRSGGGLPRR